ncbi:spermidine synthase [Flavobacterium sp. TSSA_36]|uniref:spermidine synthase n=1 Tax=Flavobacterium sp. TSSA_36 TaxID=3447669 RepID=UPI003F3E5B2D
MLKKLFSYLLPITIYKSKSTISKSIEITWTNGELVMDSKNTNYSYGSLQRILRIGLLKIGFSTIQAMDKALVLGVAGGSVIKTLINEIEFKGKIKGIDIDSRIIDVANTYFQLNSLPNVDIQIQDAFEYVLRCTEKYDLIIIDVFEDTEMPNFLFESFFIHPLAALLNPKGFILFNTMLLKKSDEERNKNFMTHFDLKQYKINAIPRIEMHNELILIQKLH